MNDTDAKQKHKYNPAEKKMLVRYGRCGIVGWFEHNEKHIPKAQSKVMIKTDRGLEIGEVVGRFCYKSGVFKKSVQAVIDYYGQGHEDCPITTGGKLVRYATEQDLSEERHINTGAKQELDKCRELIKEMKLPMKLVDIEHVFGGERIIFYFTADSRIDFRELVKKLAKEFQTRIEMRQVGSRDAAKVTADVEVCGQECCCARFLKILQPVNMKMAKLQKATLDPSKISGYCGRLKCCLRYEDHTYRDMVKRLPKRRTRVKTSQGEGLVINTQVLTQLVSVKTDDGKVFAVPLEEITILELPSKPPQNKKTDLPDRKRPADKQDIDGQDEPEEEKEEDFDDEEDSSDDQKPQQEDSREQ